MSNDSDKSISRLADALLVAEAAYQKARDHHEHERSVMSQRLLIEARHRLEYLEGCAFEISTHVERAPVNDNCPQCGGELIIERWSALAKTAHAVEVDGHQVTMVRAIPEWAVEHAIQGTAIVSRQSCRSCGTEHTISTGAVD